MSDTPRMSGDRALGRADLGSQPPAGDLLPSASQASVVTAADPWWTAV
jgi:hypothetical protein